MTARDWQCPKCGTTMRTAVPVYTITHPCYVNSKGERRTVPTIEALRPVATVQLTLDGAP